SHYRAPLICHSLCFFFQAEDGIRDRNVTGVQTCALPISRQPLLAVLGPDPLRGLRGPLAPPGAGHPPGPGGGGGAMTTLLRMARSEERRVGKEGRKERARYR